MPAVDAARSEKSRLNTLPVPPVTLIVTFVAWKKFPMVRVPESVT